MRDEELEAVVSRGQQVVNRLHVEADEAGSCRVLHDERRSDEDYLVALIAFLSVECINAPRGSAAETMADQLIRFALSSLYGAGIAAGRRAALAGGSDGAS